MPITGRIGDGIEQKRGLLHTMGHLDDLSRQRDPIAVLKALQVADQRIFLSALRLKQLAFHATRNESAQQFQGVGRFSGFGSNCADKDPAHHGSNSHDAPTPRMLTKQSYRSNSQCTPIRYDMCAYPATSSGYAHTHDPYKAATE